MVFATGQALANGGPRRSVVVAGRDTMRLILQLARHAVAKWFADDAPRAGAAIAYYAVVAVAPLMAVLVFIAGLLFGAGDVERMMVRETNALMGPAGASALAEILMRAREPTAAATSTAVGGLLLLFAATGAFVELQSSLRTMLRLPNQASANNSVVREALWERLRAAGAVLSVSALLIAMLLLEAGAAALHNAVLTRLSWWGRVSSAVQIVVSVTLNGALFALLFRSVGAHDTRRRECAIGGLVTALLFTGGKRLFATSFADAGAASAGSGLGAIGVVLLWIYLCAQVVLFGAAITRVSGDHRRAHEDAPDERTVV